MARVIPQLLLTSQTKDTKEGCRHKKLQKPSTAETGRAGCSPLIQLRLAAKATQRRLLSLWPTWNITLRIGSVVSFLGHFLTLRFWLLGGGVGIPSSSCRPVAAAGSWLVQLNSRPVLMWKKNNVTSRLMVIKRKEFFIKIWILCDAIQFIELPRMGSSHSLLPL